MRVTRARVMGSFSEVFYAARGPAIVLPRMLSRSAKHCLTREHAYQPHVDVALGGKNEKNGGIQLRLGRRTAE